MLLNESSQSERLYNLWFQLHELYSWKSKTKKILVVAGLSGTDEEGELRGFLGQWIILYSTIIMNKRHYICVQTHSIYNSKSECLVMMLCHCRFINGNKRITLVWYVDSRESCACTGQRIYWEFMCLCSILLL